jgi:hypothetical protein
MAAPRPGPVYCDRQSAKAQDRRPGPVPTPVSGHTGLGASSGLNRCVESRGAGGIQPQNRALQTLPFSFWGSAPFFTQRVVIVMTRVTSVSLQRSSSLITSCDSLCPASIRSLPPKDLMKSPLRVASHVEQHRFEPKIVHSSGVTYCLLFSNHRVTIALEQPRSPFLPISQQSGMFTHQIRFRTLNAGKNSGSLQIALPEVHFKYPSCRSICAEATWYSRASRSSHCSRC